MSKLTRGFVRLPVCRLSLTAIIAFILSPLTALAENINLFSVAERQPQGIKLAEKLPVKRLVLGLDDEGNVMVRYRKICVTLVYGPDSGVDGYKDRAGLVPPLKESQGIGEIRCKVGFVF